MRRERGSILIPVLFLSGLLGIFAAIAANIMFAAADVSRGFAETLRAREAMVGAIEQIVGHTGSALAGTRGAATVPMTNAHVTIRVFDEAARIDLNLAPEALLAGIFRAVGVQQGDADVYAARIVDWRDADDDESPGGAERELYRASGRIDGPRNGPFVHVAELVLVLGIPQRAAAAVAPYVTVVGRERINPTMSDPPVLMALPGSNEERVRRFLLERQRGVLAPDALISVLGSVQDFVSDENGQAVRLEGLVRLGAANERRFEVIVAVIEDDTEPYRIAGLGCESSRARPRASVTSGEVTLFNGFRNAWVWFVEGLVEAFAAIADGLRPREQVRLVGDRDGYRVVRSGKDSNRVQVVQGEGGPRVEPADVAASLRGKAIDIVVPGEHLLVRTLDPLPADSRPYLDDIVRHQLDRVVPWRSEDIAHAYRVVGEAGDKLVVTIAATSRAIHAQLLVALRALAPGELRLVSDNPQFGGGEITIPVDGGFAAARTARLRQMIPRGLAVFALLSVAGTAVVAYRWQQADAELVAAEEALTEQRRNTLASTQGVAGDRELDAVLLRRRTTPYVVLALDQLSIALPDDTWLTEFRVGEGRLRITGVSRNVPALVPVIEASPGFAEATFFAPTTRLQNGRGDRFHLETRLMPVERKP